MNAKQITATLNAAKKTLKTTDQSQIVMEINGTQVVCIKNGVGKVHFNLGFYGVHSIANIASKLEIK